MSFYAHTPPKDSNDFHPLQAHLTKVAKKAEEFAEKFKAGKIAYYAGVWHDLGKYNPEFQKYLEECDLASKLGNKAPSQKVPHAKYGAKLAAEKFQPIAPLIYGHHGGLPQPQYMRDRLVEIKTETYQQILENARSESLNLEITPEINRQFENLAKDNLGFELLLRILFSCLVDADYLDTETHFDPENTAIRETNRQREDLQISRLWQTLEKSQEKLLAGTINTRVNQVRSQVYWACVDTAQLEPGIFRLAVPTGGGKTRSGLSFALAHAVRHNLDRVIVAVPYTSIIEQTVEVYRDIFGQDAVLEHHSAVKPDEGNESDARSRQAMARLATQNWDAPLVVTTTVQLFESLFANRTSRCRKLHNIVNSVIILDEVQTLPVFLLDPILSVLKELCDRYRVSVVLCTATQPAFEGNSPYLQGFPSGSVKDIIPTELAKQHFSSLSRVDYQIPETTWSWQDLVKDLARREASQALIVLNTRKDALAVLDAIASTEKDSLYHLSTLLCGQHRREVLKTVRDRLKNKQPCILVSTQVVEAGVDLDFPLVYRAIAPLDRIVQAAGRCNREGKLDKGNVIVFDPQEGKLPNSTEYRKPFDETSNLLNRKAINWDDPNIFEEYFRQVYIGMDTDSKGIQEKREECNYPEVAARFKLIPDDTTAVAIAYDDLAREIIQLIKKRGLKSGDLKALQPYLVNLRSREFKQTEELREQIAAGIWVWNGNYDSIKGIAIGDQAIAYDPADLIF
jgi:CRISPR-associated endonuclease/helicase Cas3